MAADSKDKGEHEQLAVQVARLRIKLAAAKRRAKYWAGLPSFTRGSGFSTSRAAQERRAQKATDHHMEYETAMEDVISLADDLERLTGRRPRYTDWLSAKHPTA